MPVITIEGGLAYGRSMVVQTAGNGVLKVWSTRGRGTRENTENTEDGEDGV